MDTLTLDPPTESAALTVGELDVDDATALTQQIRSTVEVVWVLIVRAYEGKAWHAMGYSNWREYVEAELHHSSGAAYRLLDRAVLISQIQQVAPAGTDIRITERAAVDLRAIASQVTDDIRDRLVGTIDPIAASSIIDDVIANHRADLDQRRADKAAARDGSGLPPSGGQWTPAQIDEEAVRRTAIAAVELSAALANLTAMPDPTELAGAIPTDRRPQISAALPGALQFLTDFRDAWEGAHR